MKKKVWIFLTVTFLLKLALAAFLPVFADEAYYYIWSLHPQLSYFDHPPLVSWLISISHFVFPAGEAISLRISFVVLSFLTSLIWLKILRRFLFTEHQMMVFFVFVLLNPLLGIGSIAATPDVPLVFFWSLSYLFFLRLLDTKHLTDYVGLGISLGLGFCSKYHIVLFVLAGLISIILSKKYKQLSLIGVSLTLVIGGTFCLPVIIWNAQNEWKSFLFQINHGFGENEFSWAWPAGYLAAQTLAVNPFILWSLFKKGGMASDRVFSLSQLGFFFTSSFKSVVEGNWPLTSHLHSISNASVQLDRKKVSYAVFYWIIFYVLIAAFLFSNASFKVRKNLVNSAQLGEIYKLVDTYSPLYGPSYQVASLISWKTQKLVPKLRELSRHDFYDSLPESLPSEKQFYVLKNDYSGWPAEFDQYKKIKLQTFDNVGLELYQFIYE